MKRSIAVFTSALALTLPLVAGAATQPAAPTGPNQQTKLLHITKEWVKPGQLSTVLQSDREKAKALKDAKWSEPILGFRSVTGQDQVIFLSFYDTIAPLDEEMRTLEQNPALRAKLDKASREAGAQMNSREDIMTVYRPEITYKPQWDWAKTRCIDMLRIHLNAAKGAEYIENRKMTLESHERGGLDTHIFLYSVMSGHPSWTFFIIRPMPALAHLDYLRGSDFGEPFSEYEKKRQIELFGWAANSEEEEWFCADPSISNVPASWAGAENSFWNGK